MRNLLFPSVPQAGEYLERYPFLLNGSEEGTRTEGRINEWGSNAELLKDAPNSVIQVACDPLSDKVARFV